MTKIRLRKDLNWEEKKRAIETSLITGFYSISAEFPIVSMKEGIEIPKDLKELEEVYKSEDEDWPKDYVSSTKESKSISESDWRNKKGLESMFSKGIFLEDKNYDQLPDKLNFKIDISKECDISILIAACNFAFRYGMETTAFEGQIIAEEDWAGNILRFNKDKNCGMKLIKENNRTIIQIKGEGKEIEDFSAKVCETFPLLPNSKTWIDKLQDMTDSFAMRDLDGQLSYLKAYKNELEGSITGYMSPEIEERLDNIEEEFPNIDFKNHKSLKKIYEKSYDIPWEVDVFKDILNKKIYHNLKPEDNVEIYGALSEELDVRNGLVNEIKGELSGLGIKSKNIEIINGYKQGLSWIEEVILPKLYGKSIKEIEIRFKPFLPKREEEWVDEDGSVPSYDNIDTCDPDKWLDLPIRYLQELYPVDDIISEYLGIHRDKIKFRIYEGKEDISYKFKAISQDNENIFTASYKTSYSERPYLDDFPKMGKVHPSTGFIKVYVNGEEILIQNIKTDLENIWDIYQKEVLPECKDIIEEKTKDNIDVDGQPFFSQLRLEVSASEPDYNLSFREDMISSLNAFHEDIYFVGIDYFKNYGIKKNNVVLDAPGLILPIINKGTGKPSFKVSLYDELERKPVIVANNKTIESKLSRKEIELYLKELRYKKGKVTGILKTNIKDSRLISSYMELLDQKVLRVSNEFSNIDILQIDNGENSYNASIIKEEKVGKNLNILDIDLNEDRLIGYTEYLEIINQLKHVPGIEVYEIARSYLGRKIYAIEILPREKGYISKTKRITNLPSEIINSRHHANEVSGTNATLMLLKKLLTDDKYKALPDKLNLVLLPMENVDGSDIHYELQKDNPNWKLHVARFNAVGKEFYYEYFDPDTIYREAMGMTRLWYKWLPDVIVDNHGVPSHEWEQQFSGYTSPSYKGFWLPRALLYGYFWTIDNEEYKSNYPVNKKVEEVIADKISKNEEITRWNKEWISVFEKYAHAWMPKLFPADYYKDMINYWIPFEYDPSHRYPSIRFPWITTVAYTSEVADETAHGDYLNLCARTHVEHCQAVIDMLMESTLLFEDKFEIKEDSISIKKIRHRPLIVK
ncbi:MAG TPA: M14 family metallopeptidase [Tissierellaceae bacterium]|nr:M14 family metallopeptidase [Tissierellaceae bacterium]